MFKKNYYFQLTIKYKKTYLKIILKHLFYSFLKFFYLKCRARVIVLRFSYKNTAATITTARIILHYNFGNKCLLKNLLKSFKVNLSKHE